MEQSNQRKEWIWIAKGVAIVLVILGHYGPCGWWPPVYDQLICGVYLFHMPLFIFLSGYLFHFSLLRSDSQKFSYMKHIERIFFRLGLPFLSLNVFYVLLKLAGSCFFSYGEMDWNDVWRTFIYPFTYAPANLTWFLYVLFLCMLVYPLLELILRRKQFVLLFSLVLFFLPGATFLASDRFFRFFLFFCSGNCLRNISFDKIFHSLLEKKGGYLLLFIGTTLAFGIVTAITLISPYGVMGAESKLALLGSFSGILCVILISFFIEHLQIKRLYRRMSILLGQYSLGIYLFHQPFVWFFPVLIHKIGGGGDLEKLLLVGLPLSLFSGIFFPILIEKYFLKKNIYLSLFFLGGR